MNWKEKVISAANNVGWDAEEYEEGNWNFQIYSPQGQDCTCEYSDVQSLDELIEELEWDAEHFDASEETIVWLDNFGHGMNGAPYDMKDVYEDMVWKHEMEVKLYDALLNCV